VALESGSTELIEAWADRAAVWLIVALRRNRRPGTIHRIDALADPWTKREPPDHGGMDPAGRTEVPASGLALDAEQDPALDDARLQQVITLGRAQGRLPPRLVVMGIEPDDVSHGWRLSPPVESAFAGLVLLVTREVERLMAGNRLTAETH
jgi:hypothetical protein